MKKLICLDASIQSSGVSIYDYETERTQLYTYSDKVKKAFQFSIKNFDVVIDKQEKCKDDDTFRRYMGIADKIYTHIEPHLTPDTKIFMEGYSYASKGLVFNIGEFGALLKLPFYKADYIIKLIAPSDWKKHITGKGNATKDVIYNTMLSTELREVLAEFLVRGYQYKKGSWIEDICDVYSIQKYVLSGLYLNL